MELSDVGFSVLDLAPIRQGDTAAQALANSLDLARACEAAGYDRFWLAEHHGMPGIASAATAVVIAHVAAGTQRIRVGAGGIMLPNHAPLIIAEQFGTLESLHPGRIDLGLGRAPGGDVATARALRRYLTGGADSFPDDLVELQGYFRKGGPGTGVHAVPGEGLAVPIWLLGSSDFSAKLAAKRGLPFAFASHFAPALLGEALTIYRRYFEPSPALDRPRVMVGVNVVCADTDEEARRLFTSLEQAFLNLVRGERNPLPPPVDSMAGKWTCGEEAEVLRMTQCSAVGSPETVRAGLEAFARATEADELMIAAHIHGHAARVRSYELAATLRRR